MAKIVLDLLLNAMGLDASNRNAANNVKMRKIEKITYKETVKNSENLTAELILKKVLDKRKTNGLIYFVVDFSACSGKHVGTFSLVLKQESKKVVVA